VSQQHIEGDHLYCFVFTVADAPGFVIKVGRSAQPYDRQQCYKNRPYYVRETFAAAAGIDNSQAEIVFSDVQRWLGLGFIEVRVLRALRRRFEYTKLEWFYVADVARLITFVDSLRDIVEKEAMKPSVTKSLF
jgi:hypothetical protein